MPEFLDMISEIWMGMLTLGVTNNAYMPPPESPSLVEDGSWMLSWARSALRRPTRPAGGAGMLATGHRYFAWHCRGR
jgi:hypothetical protein